MNLLFKIKCHSCGCRFELTSNDFGDKEQLECPNCSQPFPVDDFQSLRSAILSIRTLNPTICGVDGKGGFELSLSFEEELPF